MLETKPRLRVAHVIVQPILVYDDGEELTPGPRMEPVQVRLSDLATLGDTIRASVAAAQTPDTPSP